MLLVLLLAVHVDIFDSGILDDHCELSRYLAILGDEEFSGIRIEYILRSDSIHQSVMQAELAIVLESSDLGQVITPLVEEQSHQHRSCILDRRRLARSQPPVQLSQAVSAVPCSILLKGLEKPLILSEDSDYIFVAAQCKSVRIDDAQSSQE